MTTEPSYKSGRQGNTGYSAFTNRQKVFDNKIQTECIKIP